MTIDSPTSPDPTVNKLTGTEGGRPEVGNTYFLATGSIRINGYRFKFGDALPDKEGKALAEQDRPVAVKGRENLRDENGERTVPYLRGNHMYAHPGDQPTVTDHDGVHVPDTERTGQVDRAEARTSVTDSQAGQRTEQNEAQKPARQARK